jgi:hypothetical protein
VTIIADISSFLGSVFFAGLCAVAAFVAGYWVRSKKQF